RRIVHILGGAFNAPKASVTISKRKGWGARLRLMRGAVDPAERTKRSRALRRPQIGHASDFWGFVPLLRWKQQDLAAALVGFEEVTGAELLLLQNDSAETYFRRGGWIDEIAFEAPVCRCKSQDSLIAARI